MEYDISAFVKDFASRTQKNLTTIEQIALDQSDEEPQVYEVTQLINSLLGLLIIPQQALDAALNTDFQFNSYSFYDNGELQDLILSLQNRKYLYPSNQYVSAEFFIRHMRNAVAHPERGIQFYPISEYILMGNSETRRSNRTKRITCVYFMDSNKEDGVVFCVRLSLDEVKKVALSISNSISQMLTYTATDQVIKQKETLEEMRTLVPGTNSMQKANRDVKVVTVQMR